MEGAIAMPQQLWAKSPRPDGKKLTLEQHLLDTEKAALFIFKDRILQNWCRFFKVCDANKFLRHLQIAALFHDIGKANAEFYAAVTGSRETQTLRHEWFSALILHLKSVRAWLEPSGLDLEAIAAAVLCHHLKASYKDWAKPRTQVKQVELYLNYPEVNAILRRIAEVAGVEGLPELPKKWIAEDNFWEQVYLEANQIGRQFSRQVKRDDERRSLMLAVKAGVIAADSAASGLFREGYSIQQWIDDTLHRPPITPEEIETEILQPRYRQISSKSGQEFKLKNFQRKAQDLGDRVLLLSGCGTGKTIFAYKWEQSALTRYEVGHIIFLYPTRGTATEGFKDYVSWAPESDASLLTGTASYELMEMAKNPGDSSEGKDFTTEERLFALGFWGKRFFSATVDQFLSFLTHSYSGLCLLPVLADCVVVIDEIHSFSRGMFDNLISFLEHFDIPVLCMTATLPKTRRLELERVGLKVFSTVADEELEKVEKQPRYNVQATDFDTAYHQAIEAYQKGDRVLWVVNTVDRCRDIAANLENTLGVEVLTYHSRFRLKDRQKRHKETVDAFAYQKDDRQPAIAVTTQVCEMSLDLDADVLISELAPISALVQRFGRSNRHLSRGSDFLSQIFVYEPPKVLPYKPKELDKAREFLAEVSGAVSQWQLAEKLEHYSLDERFADGSSRFVEGGYWATSEPFRDTDDYSVDALLDTDLNAVKELVNKREPYDGYVVPVPKRLLTTTEGRPAWMPRYLEIADHHKYCPRRGFGE
jgi:CRISPR-associated endonuclease/helicase Cas3